MSLFGKILAVVNILAAIAFLVLAARDYGHRQEVTYQVFHAERVINGLPVDAQDDSDNPVGGPLVDQIGPRLLEDIYSGNAGGTTLGSTSEKPATVLDEVERVRRKVAAAVGTGSEAEKKKALAGFYLTQVKDAGEREKLAARLGPAGREPAAKLAEELDQRFFGPVAAPLRSPGSTEAKANQDPDSRRLAAAHLLFNLAPADMAWQQRVSAVVGLKAYVAAVDRSASILADANALARKMLRDDYLAFDPRYQQLVQDARDLADRLAEGERRLRKQQEQVQNHDALVKSRRVEVAEFENYLKEARAETVAQLAAQAELEQQLFQIQRNFVATQQKNDQLEGQLKDLEAKFQRKQPAQR
jgi:hypothetical protein